MRENSVSTNFANANLESLNLVSSNIPNSNLACTKLTSTIKVNVNLEHENLKNAILKHLNEPIKNCKFNERKSGTAGKNYARRLELQKFI